MDFIYSTLQRKKNLEWLKVQTIFQIEHSCKLIKVKEKDSSLFLYILSLAKYLHTDQYNIGISTDMENPG